MPELEVRKAYPMLMRCNVHLTSASLLTKASCACDSRSMSAVCNSTIYQQCRNDSDFADSVTAKVLLKASARSKSEFPSGKIKTHSSTQVHAHSAELFYYCFRAGSADLSSANLLLHNYSIHAGLQWCVLNRQGNNSLFQLIMITSI